MFHKNLILTFKVVVTNYYDNTGATAGTKNGLVALLLKGRLKTLYRHCSNQGLNIAICSSCYKCHEEYQKSNTFFKILSSLARSFWEIYVIQRIQKKTRCWNKTKTKLLDLSYLIWIFWRWNFFNFQEFWVFC